MIKKISIFLFILIIFTTCGKKGDPIYNKQNQNSEIFSTQESTIS
jgi:hypothetical protein|tara:strand:- start:2745 stop:2879 length:135 start_codon:yes stop_codon:yes gene_type:complete